MTSFDRSLRNTFIFVFLMTVCVCITCYSMKKLDTDQYKTEEQVHKEPLQKQKW